MDIRPSRARLEALIPQAERYFGEVVRGPVWDRLLREYYFERVFVDITVERVVVWPDLSAAGPMEVTGVPWPGAAAAQPEPGNGTGPRVDTRRAAGRIAIEISFEAAPATAHEPPPCSGSGRCIPTGVALNADSPAPACG